MVYACNLFISHIYDPIVLQLDDRSRVSDGDSNDATTDIIYSVDATKRFLVVTNAHANEMYEVMVRAVNDRGNQGEGSPAMRVTAIYVGEIG